MGLMDEFKSEKVRTGTFCRVQIIREQLTVDDLVDLDDAMKDATITAAAIERVLKRKGLVLPAGTITRHRRRECTCGQ